MKYVLYTNYTYIVLDLTQDVPSDIEILQDHPGKTEKANESKTWFDNLKISQSKYLKDETQLHPESDKKPSSKVKNLTISNKIKGIISMEYNSEEKKLMVVENLWKKALEAFPGTVAIPKYGQ